MFSLPDALLANYDDNGTPLPAFGSTAEGEGVDPLAGLALAATELPADSASPVVGTDQATDPYSIFPDLQADLDANLDPALAYPSPLSAAAAAATPAETEPLAGLPVSTTEPPASPEPQVNPATSLPSFPDAQDDIEAKLDPALAYPSPLSVAATTPAPSETSAISRDSSASVEPEGTPQAVAPKRRKGQKEPNPNPKRKYWTPEQDAALLAIKEDPKKHDWTWREIAGQLDCGHRAVQCRARYLLLKDKQKSEFALPSPAERRLF